MSVFICVFQIVVATVMYMCVFVLFSAFRKKALAEEREGEEPEATLFVEITVEMLFEFVFEIYFGLFYEESLRLHTCPLPRRRHLQGRRHLSEERIYNNTIINNNSKKNNNNIIIIITITNNDNSSSSSSRNSNRNSKHD